MALRELCDRDLVWRPPGAPEPLVIDVAAYFAGVLGDGGAGA